MSWINNLWENKRWLFWLLIPVILLWVFKDFVINLMLYLAKRDIDIANKTDIELRDKTAAATQKASNAEAKADQIDKKIEDRKEHDTSLDWHKHTSS